MRKCACVLYPALLPIAMALLAVLSLGAARADFVGHGGMVRSVAISPDGRKLLSGSFDYSAMLWDFEEQGEIAVLDAHAGPVNKVLFLSDGQALSAGDDGVVNLWSLAPGADKPLRRFTGHKHKVMALSAAPGSGFVASGSWDKTVQIWNPADGKTAMRIDLPVPVNALAYAGDGLLAVGGHDPFIRLYDPATGRAKGKLEGHLMAITDLAASTDGRWLLSASIDKTVWLWDLAQMKPVRTYRDHDKPVYAVRFLPGGHSFVSAGGDGLIAFWRTGGEAPERVIQAGTRIVWALAVSPDGRFSVSAGADETLKVWHLESGDRISVAGDEALADEPKPWLSSDHPGARLYRKCARCHSLEDNGRRRSGPHLKGLFGRVVGTVPGYNYSTALRGKEFTWTRDTLFELFHDGPDKMLPGTKMPVQRVPDGGELAQLIDYLKIITASE